MNQYLRLYAEPEVAALGDLSLETPWTNALVIPACNETPGFLRPLPASLGRSLMILVINEAEPASFETSASNVALANEVEQQFELLWSSGPQFRGFGLNLFRDPGTPRDILLVDRFSNGRRLAGKGGVGLARKIGCDLAASLIHKEAINCPWIHCSDADVYLPETYFSFSNLIEDSSACSALVYPYQHSDAAGNKESEAVLRATRLYEVSLRYYVAGLKFAGSPYAYHTIGSTMVVNAHHYAKVRGFPRREAGEDFYLLNKLAKVGRVMEFESSPECLPIIITSRRSDRVPFGTGAAVNKITTLADPMTEFRFYHPDVFTQLKYWLQALPTFWESKSTDLASGLAGSHPALGSGLAELGAEKALAHALRQSKNLDQFSRQMHTWFDAFRTLKLVHYLRDSYLPSVAYAELAGSHDNFEFRTNITDV